MVDVIQIYVLKEPDSLKIRYVGMTSKSLKQRLRKHLDNALYTKHNLHLCNWILKYYKNNNLPIIELKEVCTKENWQEREKYWINYYPDLLNATNGGEGSFGFKHSEETKTKIRFLKKGIKPSKECLKKRSKALKGRILSEDHKNKIGKANKGKILTTYNIKIIDKINFLEYIFKNVKEASLFLNCSINTIRRKLNNNKLYKNQFCITKI